MVFLVILSVIFLQYCFYVLKSYPLSVALVSINIPFYVFCSLTRIIIALFISVITGIIISNLISRSGNYSIFDTIIDVLQSIPILAFLSFNVSNNFFSKEINVIYALIATQIWNIIVCVSNDLKYIPKGHIQLAKTCDFNNIDIFLFIQIPRILPGLIWNCMLSISGCWFCIVPIEAYQSYSVIGIGSFIELANINKRTDLLILAGINILFCIMLLDRFVWKNLLCLSKKLIKGEIIYPFFKCNKKISYLLDKVVDAIKISMLIFITYKIITEFIPILMLIVKSNNIIGIIMEFLYVLKLCFLSFFRIILSIGISSLIAIPIGIYIGVQNNIFQDNSRLIFQIFTSIPINLIYFIFFKLEFFFRYNYDLLCVIPLTVASIWYIIFNVQAGSNMISSKYKIPINKINITNIFKIYFPAIVNEYISGIISASGAAWNSTILCEFISWGNKKPFYANGIGSYLIHLYNYKNKELLFISIFFMAIFIAIINQVFWRKIIDIIKSKVYG